MLNGILKSYERVLAVSGSIASLGSAIVAANAGLWEVAGVLGGLPAAAGAAWWIRQRGFVHTELTRREESRTFALGANHENLLVASGGSWLPHDLHVYEMLLDAGQRVRLLLGSHAPSKLVAQAVRLGMEVRQVERERLNGFRGAISDPCEPDNARVFSVEKRYRPVRGAVARVAEYKTRICNVRDDRNAAKTLKAMEALWRAAAPSMA